MVCQRKNRNDELSQAKCVSWKYVLNPFYSDNKIVSELGSEFVKSCYGRISFSIKNFETDWESVTWKWTDKIFRLKEEKMRVESSFKSSKHENDQLKRQLADYEQNFNSIRVELEHALKRQVFKFLPLFAQA